MKSAGDLVICSGQKYPKVLRKSGLACSDAVCGVCNLNCACGDFQGSYKVSERARDEEVADKELLVFSFF